MIGYCEGCAAERNSEPDEYGVGVCVDCGNDLIIEVHVEVDEPEEDDGYEYPQFYDGPY